MSLIAGLNTGSGGGGGSGTANPKVLKQATNLGQWTAALNTVAGSYNLSAGQLAVGDRLLVEVKVRRVSGGAGTNLKLVFGAASSSNNAITASDTSASMFFEVFVTGATTQIINSFVVRTAGAAVGLSVTTPTEVIANALAVSVVVAAGSADVLAVDSFTVTHYKAA